MMEVCNGCGNPFVGSDGLCQHCRDILKKVSFGMNVSVRMLVKGKEKWETFYNVTEVHYRYPRGVESFPPNRVAFESDIHGTGITYSLEPGGLIQVLEFEVRPATKKHEQF